MAATAGYVTVLLAALALTAGLMPAVRRLAQATGIVDVPGGRKHHPVAVPLLGGLAMAVAFDVVLLAGALFLPGAEIRRELAATVGLAVVVLLLGLADDARGLSPWTRLGVETLVGAGTWAAGLGVSLFSAEPLNALATVAWVAVVVNALNLLDNMDGLSSGVAAIAALWFLLIAAANGQVLVALLAAAVAGCALGFLRHNLPPARIYMGDAGALFLGFCLAVVGMKLRFAGPAHITFFVPILVLGVPLLDTALVTVTRLAAGRSPFDGGRDHASHRLVRLGASPQVAVAALWSVGMGLGWAGLVMSRVDTATAFALMGLIVVTAAAATTLLVAASARRADTPIPTPALGRASGSRP